MRRTGPVLIGGLFVLYLPSVSFAQRPGVASPRIATAFQNVNLISMERDHVETGRTVLVARGRIVAIGATSDVAIPAGADVIDAAGRYLVPGLTDAHVHLEAWEGVRPDFGDGPLSGELVGPTIYTSGEFVIGPWGPELRDRSGRLVVGSIRPSFCGRTTSSGPLLSASGRTSSLSNAIRFRT